jgi:hypothetical protein
MTFPANHEELQIPFPPLPFIPRFSYFGSKANLARRIVACFVPEYGHRFVEPFAGRANIYFAAAVLCDYDKFWLNDTNSYKFLEAIRSGKSVLPRSAKVGIPTHRRLKAAKKAGLESYKGINVAIMEPLTVWSGGYMNSAGRKSRGEGGPSVEGYVHTCLRAYQVMQVTKPRITHWHYTKVLAQCGPDDLVYL